MCLVVLPAKVSCQEMHMTGQNCGMGDGEAAKCWPLITTQLQH